MHGELADHGLSGPGGGTDQDTAAPLQSLARLPLEVVKIESKVEGEVVKRWKT